MIVIIGGTGFIGKHLCLALAEARLAATTLSRSPDVEFLAKHAPSTRSLSIDKFYRASYDDEIESATSIVYLASSSIPSQADNSAAHELNTNVKNAIDVCERITSVNPNAHLIYLSSGGTVYGPGHEVAIPESAITKPVTPYAFGKVVIEKYLYLLSCTRKTRFTILRAANPIGQWQTSSNQGFVGVALRSMRERKPIKIYGSGETIRDYFDVDDLCAAIISCCQNPDVSAGKTWNVGSGQGKNLLQVLDVIEKATGQNLVREHVLGRPTDLNFNVLDCRQIGHALGWKCENSLEATIRKIWQSQIQL